MTTRLPRRWASRRFRTSLLVAVLALGSTSATGCGAGAATSPNTADAVDEGPPRVTFDWEHEAAADVVYRHSKNQRQVGAKFRLLVCHTSLGTEVRVRAPKGASNLPDPVLTLQVGPNGELANVNGLEAMDPEGMSAEQEFRAKTVRLAHVSLIGLLWMNSVEMWVGLPRVVGPADEPYLRNTFGGTDGIDVSVVRMTGDDIDVEAAIEEVFEGDDLAELMSTMGVDPGVLGDARLVRTTNVAASFGAARLLPTHVHSSQFIQARNPQGKQMTQTVSDELDFHWSHAVGACAIDSEMTIAQLKTH